MTSYYPDTKLTRFGARDYDPSIGRWLQRDPIKFDGGTTNLYEYCGNDSVNCFDHSGLMVGFDPVKDEFGPAPGPGGGVGPGIIGIIIPIIGAVCNNNDSDNGSRKKDCDVKRDNETKLCNSLYPIASDIVKNSNCLERMGYRYDQCNNGVPEGQRLQPFPSGYPL